MRAFSMRNTKNEQVLKLLLKMPNPQLAKLDTIRKTFLTFQFFMLELKLHNLLPGLIEQLF